MRLRPPSPQAFADRLAHRRPGPRGPDYAANARAFQARLAALDGEFRTGLAPLRQPTIVTSHNAFGYLAQRYGLSQVGITGLSPEAEPEPAKLGRRRRPASRRTTSPRSTPRRWSAPRSPTPWPGRPGARVATLDPIEGLTDSSAGQDYFAVMRSNLAALRAGQGCS